MLNYVVVIVECNCNLNEGGRGPRLRPWPRSLRGWRSMVGNLIEISWLERKEEAGPFAWHMRETQRGTLSSNSRFQTALAQQYSASLSILWSEMLRDHGSQTGISQTANCDPSGLTPGEQPVCWMISPVRNKVLIKSNPSTCRISVRRPAVHPNRVRTERLH